MFGSPSRRQLLPLAAMVLLSPLLAWVVPEYLLYVGNVLMMDAILAIGLDILLGWSGQFAFAHIAFFGIGIYGTALLGMRAGVPFLLGMPLSALLAAAVGFVIALPATRLREVYLALATFAFAESMQWLIRTWDSLTNGPDGLRITAPALIGYVVGTDRRAFVPMAVLLAAMLAATLYLTRSNLGRSLSAIRDSEHAAATSGIDVRRTKVAAFTISAFYAGVAGGSYTLFGSFIHPDDLGIWQLVQVLTMIVVGGSGSIPGVLLGVLLVGLLPELLRVAPAAWLVWQELAYGLILTLAVMFLPNGLRSVLRRPARATAPPRARTAPVVEHPVP